MAKKPLTDDEIKVIVDSEIQSAMGEHSGELSEERATAMERYLGEPDGKEMEGRSHIQSRDVMDVIEWILPSLIRMFTQIDSSVEIEPVGPEDEDAAEQETDYVNHLFFKKNPGFLILYTFFKDALLSKNGIVKPYAEEEEEVKREEYDNLLDIEYQQLLADDEVELTAHTQRTEMMDNGQPIQVHDVVITRKENKVEIEVDNVPPEEFLISTDTKSIDPKDARFSGQHTTKVVSDLREMGFSEEDIDKMQDGPNAVEFEEERYERMHLSDEQRHLQASEANEAMLEKRITECYLYADRDGDGFAEILKVFRSGDFIDIEEVDRVPYCAITPIILTHKFFGLSVADLIIDIQESRTGLRRAYFDNIAQTINGTTYYDENVTNIEDMLTSKPYGNRAVDGNPHQAILAVPPSGLPPEAFTLDELMKDIRADRIGDFQSQLDPNILANANNGVVVEMLNEAKAKVEMIARIFAETGVKQLFRDLHELARKHGDKEEIVKLRNQWIPVNPSSWRERTDFTVKVGLGIRNRQEEAVSLGAIMDKQIQMMELGQLAPMHQGQDGQPVFPLYESSKRFAEIMGEANPDKYFPHPSTMPPPPPPQPDPNADVLALTAQVEAAKNQTKQIEVQLKAANEAQKTKIEQEKAMSDISAKAAKQDSDEVKQQLTVAQQTQDNALKEMQLAITAQAQEEKLEFEQTKLALEQHIERQNMKLQKYEADLSAATDLLTTKNGQDVETIDNTGSDRLLAGLLDEITGLKTQLSAPKQVVRDDQGNIIQIGTQRVTYDESGLVTGLE